MELSKKPLTLEELRGMDGKPLFGVSLITGKPGEWFICRIVNMSNAWFIACGGASQGFGDKDTYGETWIAYAPKHHRIDRKVWCAEWVDFRGKPRCPECKSVFPENYFDWPFCPKCGKAMTDAAWKIIKKRLEGNGDDQP